MYLSLNLSKAAQGRNKISSVNICFHKTFHYIENAKFNENTENIQQNIKNT